MLYQELKIKEINSTEKGPVDLNRIISEALIDPREEIKAPETVYYQQTESRQIIMATLGNFSMIIGKAKSRKSFLMIIIAALLASSNSVFNFFSKLSESKNQILFFDTEQSKYHAQLLLHRICRMINVKIPDNVSVYCLRKYNPTERLEIIEKVLYSKQNLGVAVIDGIRDLITSINDEEQATMISSKLLKWSEELNIHIFIVLHQNKNDNNARGHAGTELGNKAETVLCVSKSEGDDKISVVEPLMCRNPEPETFAFEIIDDLPVPAENYEVRKQTKSSKIDVYEIEDFKLFEMLNAIYSRQNEYSYSSLYAQVKYEFKNKFDKLIGDNKSKEIVTYCKNKEWLIQDGDKKPYKLGEYKSISV